MRDTGWSKSDDALMADIERDGFGTLADPRFQTPVLYLGDRVSFVSSHPTAPDMTMHGEIVKLGDNAVTVAVEELDCLLDVPYSEVSR